MKQDQKNQVRKKNTKNQISKKDVTKNTKKSTNKDNTSIKNQRQSDLINKAIYRTKMRELNPYDFEDLNEDEIKQLKANLEKKIANRKQKSNQIEYQTEEQSSKLQQNKQKDKKKIPINKPKLKTNKKKNFKQKSFNRKNSSKKQKQNKNKSQVGIKKNKNKKNDKKNKKIKNKKKQNDSQKNQNESINIKIKLINKDPQNQEDYINSQQSLIKLQNSNKNFVQRKESSAKSIVKFDDQLSPNNQNKKQSLNQISSEEIQIKQNPLMNTNNFFEQFDKNEIIPIKATKRLTINLVKKHDIKKNSDDQNENNKSRSIDLSVIAKSPKNKKKDSINKSYFDEKEMLYLLDNGVIISNKDNIDDVSIVLTQTDRKDCSPNIQDQYSKKFFNRKLQQGTFKRDHLKPQDSNKNWQSSKLLTPKSSNNQMRASYSGNISEVSYHEQMDDIYDKVEDQLDSLYKSIIGQESINDQNKSKNKKKRKRKTSQIRKNSKIVLQQQDDKYLNIQVSENEKISSQEIVLPKISTDDNSSISQKLNQSESNLQQNLNVEQQLETKKQQLTKYDQKTTKFIDKFQIDYNKQTKNITQQMSNINLQNQNKQQQNIEIQNTNSYNQKQKTLQMKTQKNFLFVQNSIKNANKNLIVEQQKIFSQQQSIKKVLRKEQIKKQLYYNCCKQQYKIEKIQEDIRNHQWQEHVQRKIHSSNNFSYTPKQKKKKNRQQKFQQYINYQPQYIVINNNNQKKKATEQLTESSQQNLSCDTNQSKFIISQVQKSISQNRSKIYSKKTRIYCYSPFTKARQNLSLLDNLNKSVSEYSNYNDYSMEIRKKQDNVLQDIFQIIYQFQNKIQYWKEILFQKKSKNVLQKLYWSFVDKNTFNEKSFIQLLEWANIEVSKNFVKKFLNFFNCIENDQNTELSQYKFYRLFQVKEDEIEQIKFINKTKFQQEILQQNLRIQKRLVKKMIELQFEMFKKLNELKIYMTLDDIQDFMSYFIDNIYYPDFIDSIPKFCSQLNGKNLKILFEFLKPQDRIFINEEDLVQFYLFFNNKVKNNQLQCCIQSKPKIIYFFFNQSIFTIQLSNQILIYVFIFLQ